MSKLILWTLVLMAGTLVCADDITTNDGKTYKNVTISSVTPAGFDICYTPKGGGLAIKEILFKNLPEKYQKKYNYNPEKAAAFQARVQQYQAAQYSDMEKEYRKRLAEANEENQAEAAIYAGRMNVMLKSVYSIPGGCVAWADSLDATPTQGHYGEFIIMGADLPSGAAWGGNIYPAGHSADTRDGKLPVYCTSLEQAVILARQHFQYNPAQ